VVTNPFTVIQGPRSWSPPVCRLVLWNRVLEPTLNIRVIYICNFFIACLYFLACVLRFGCRNCLLGESIKLCFVHNQRSSGVTVAGFESCWLEARSWTSSSPQSNLSTTSQKIGPGLIIGDCRHLDGWCWIDWWGDLMIVSAPKWRWYFWGVVVLPRRSAKFQL